MTSLELRLLSQQEVERPRSEVIHLDTAREIMRGNEGRKFIGLDVRSLDLGFSTGFLSIDDSDYAQARHSKWQMLRQQGLNRYLTQHNILVEAVDERGARQAGTLCEDLCADGSVIFEKEDYDLLAGPQRPPLLVEASRWLIQYIDRLNQGSPEEIRDRIHGIEDFRIRDGFRWSYDFYIRDGKQSQLPRLDPLSELAVQDVLQMLEGRGWSVGHEVFFILTSRTSNPMWPFERRVIIGDLGGFLLPRSDTPGMDRWHQDQLYGMLDFIYTMGTQAPRDEA